MLLSTSGWRWWHRSWSHQHGPSSHLLHCRYFPLLEWLQGAWRTARHVIIYQNPKAPAFAGGRFHAGPCRNADGKAKSLSFSRSASSAVDLWSIARSGAIESFPSLCLVRILRWGRQHPVPPITSQASQACPGQPIHRWDCPQLAEVALLLANAL